MGIWSASIPASGGDITSPKAWMANMETANAVAAMRLGTACKIAVFAGASAAKIAVWTKNKARTNSLNSVLLNAQ
jgi:hypothetical protein